ncbi:hypothetical protein GCM10010443_16680 [Actinoplanes cyaneus]
MGDLAGGEERAERGSGHERFCNANPFSPPTTRGPVQTNVPRRVVFMAAEPALTVAIRDG